MKSAGRRVRTSLRVRFLVVGGAVLLAASLGQALSFFLQSRKNLEHEFDKRGAALAGMLAAETWALLARDTTGVAAENGLSVFEDRAADLAGDPDVAYTLIQDVHGNILGFDADEGFDMQLVPAPIMSAGAAIEPVISLRNQRGDEVATFSVPVCSVHHPLDEAVHHEDRREPCNVVAVVRVGLSPDRVLDAVAGSLWWSVALALLATAAGMAGILFLTRWALRPISHVAGAARAVAQGDLSTKLEEEWDGELGGLVRAFNEMTWSLADSQEELARRHSELQMVAMEKERLYHNAQVRATRLQVLNELAKAMASSLEPEEIYAHVQRQLSRLMQYEYLTVQRYLPETHEFRRDFVWTDVPSGAPEVGEVNSAEGSPVKRVQHTKMPLSIPDFDKEPTLAGGWLAQAGYSSGFIVPIMARDEFLGILGLACRRKNAFARMEVATVFAIADTLAVILKNADLYHRLQKSFADLTEVQNRLARSENVRRAEKLRAVGQMASGIAHNFNNVMSAIIGRVQLLKLKSARGGLTPAQIEEAMDIVERAALDGAETVRRLQEFGRGAGNDHVERTDLNEVIRSVVEITRPRWKDQSEQQGTPIEMKTQLAAGLPLVACVPSEIREVLTNLIFNAVDAMPEGGVITVTTKPDETAAVLEVSDTGTGMAPEVREKIFDPFFTTKGTRGSGLGLSTVYGIVERNRGQISVRSELGEGTTFVLRLPLAKESTPSGEHLDLMAARPWRILVGDDEPNVREALGDLLRLLGHEVYLAHSGAATVEAFKNGEFDLVFTDLGMPDMNGWQVTDAIRALDEHVPIVLATGWGSEISEAAAQQKGVTRVLSKPFTVQKLSSLVAELQGMARAA